MAAETDPVRDALEEAADKPGSLAEAVAADKDRSSRLLGALDSDDED